MFGSLSGAQVIALIGEIHTGIIFPQWWQECSSDKAPEQACTIPALSHLSLLWEPA